MPVTYTITAENTEELFEKLRDAVRRIDGDTNVALTATTTTPVQAPVPAPTPAPTPAPVAVPTTQAPVPLAPAPAYTVEQLAHAGANLVVRDPSKGTAAQALLTQFGVSSVTELPAERYGEFAVALRGLGAEI